MTSQLTEADHETLWEEIQRLDPSLKPVEWYKDDDITVEDWRVKFGVGDKAARSQMITFGKRPGWQTLHVANPSGAGRLLVLRKIDTPAE